jgi:rhamnogalacturonan endolyase
MKPKLLTLVLSLCALTLFSGSAQPNYDFSRIRMESLGRGVIAVRKSPEEVFVTWRYLSRDPKTIAFNVYRNGTLINDRPISDVTYFVDANTSSASAMYEVRPVKGKRETGFGNGTFSLPANAPIGYLPIALDTPPNMSMPNGEVARYSPNDCSIGDVDGDGEYEIFLKWDPSNARDNAHPGFTGTVYFDCLKLDGTRLWRINLGRNIRAGAHYTQFLVYDLDGDGCAELVCKTSDGTVDGVGKVIGDPDADYVEKEGPLMGRIMSGNEYLTVFNGRTGAAMQTIEYTPGRGEEGIWGDKNGNRSERYLAAVAYLDGIRPSAVMCRGYYTRATLAAYDWDGKNLTMKWLFDSHSDPSLKGYEGQGNHNLRVSDIDGDGRDEIVYGSCAIDHDGTGLYTTGLGHGDSMHIGHMIPGTRNQQVWIGHESRGIGSTLVDAKTGRLYYRIPSNTDVGRSMAADIDPTNPGWEMWSSASGGIRNYKGDVIGEPIESVNFAAWWDGDLSRELLDKNRIQKYNPVTRKLDLLQEFEGAASINGTKSTPCISGDLYGDWREEVLLRSADNKELRLYVSTLPTSYRFHTFLEEPVYRVSIANENVCYNQPPEAGFYFGADLAGKFRGTKIKGIKLQEPSMLWDVLLDSVLFQPQRRPSGPQAPWPGRQPQALRQDNSYTDATPDSLDLAKTVRPVAGSSRKGNNPVLFLVGNSTMRTGTRGNGDNGQWGWGYHADKFFDTEQITVENQALGGLSCRTFYRDWWTDVIKGVQPGDYVVIELGHNDSGPYDTPTGRSSIPGTGKETVEVTLRDGRKETVYSYGEYLRKFIDETRAKSASPLLFTLTPRNQWKDGKIQRKTDTFNVWIREIAQEKGVPVIDLEEISARKFEAFGPEKVNTLFYGDNIHTSDFGAMNNARSAAEGIAVCEASDLKQYLLPLDPPKQEFEREKGKPALIVTGDSTIENADSDPDGMWGWGSVLETVFDPEKITLVNAGKAGRSARTFLNEGRWDRVYNAIEPGDFVVIQFGHNDMGPLGRPPYRSEIAGTSNETQNIFMADKRKYEVIYTYGWYLRKFIGDVREKGGIPILVSITPRNEWPDGKMERRNDTFGTWCKEVVAQTGVDFIDMHNITADYFDSIGHEATKPYYKNDHTHTSRMGAERNAKSFADGLVKANHPLSKYLKQ